MSADETRRTPDVEAEVQKDEAKAAGEGKKPAAKKAAARRPPKSRRRTSLS